MVNMEANGRPDSSQTQGRKTCKNPPKIFSGKLYFIQTLQKAIFLKKRSGEKNAKKSCTDVAESTNHNFINPTEPANQGF